MAKITKIRSGTREKTNFDENQSNTPKGRQTRTKPPESEKELNIILDYVYQKSPLLSMTFELQSLTGLRYSDASQIEWDDVMLSDGTYREYLSVTQIKKYNILKNQKKYQINTSDLEENSNVFIPIGEKLIQLFENLRVFTEGHTFIFSNRRTRMTDDCKVGFTPAGIKAVNKMLLKTSKNLKLNYNLNSYSFRKYRAMKLLDSGASIAVIRDCLVHSNVQSTNQYLSTFLRDIKKYSILADI